MNQSQFVEAALANLIAFVSRTYPEATFATAMDEARGALVRMQEDRKSQAEVVARIMNRDVTRGELSEAFNRVADKAHWKNPIDARVLIGSDFEMEVLREAIVFFAGCRPTFTPVRLVDRIAGEFGGRGVYRVQAVGYFAAIGA